ncbi:MAG: hypothetical protein QOD71_1024, partial [Thermoleophilaceae bacterium]|nr:hypothetical protein [Thermoleophilaceae bacterium]
MRRSAVATTVVALLGAAGVVFGFGSGEQVAGAEGLAALSPLQQRLISGPARR